MNPYKKYDCSEPTIGWTRIEMLLALYDGAISRLTKAEMALSNGDVPVATPYVAKAQLIVSELSAGVRTEFNEEMGTNILRLYEFVVNELRSVRRQNVSNAKKILIILREGFETIREDANNLERSGELVGADRLQMVLATA
jgi:flagellar secretion chaperone FliS